MSECLECQNPPPRQREGKAQLTPPSISTKQKEYTPAFLREGEAALSLTGRKILSDSGLVCRKSVCVTQIMQLNRPGAVKEKVCRSPWDQSEGDSTDSFFLLTRFPSFALLPTVATRTSTCRSSAHILLTTS